MPAWINLSAVLGLASTVFLGVVLLGALRWIGRRAFCMAQEWCDDRLLSLLHVQEVSRRSKSELTIGGLKAVILEKSLSQRLLDLRVYDHDLHRERRLTLKVASPFHPFGFKACEPQWHDEGIALRAKNASTKALCKSGALSA